jgi:GNAT superfamily N-acetyltransferase
MEIKIRNAEKGDMPQVLELIKELALFEREPNAVEVTVGDLESAGFGDNPQFTCFVAELAGEIIGMALVYFRFSTWKGRTIHLEDLIIKENMRSRGAGSKLYRRVMEFAREKGVKRVNWEVLDWNEGAIQFYERTGAHVMHDWRPVAMHLDALNKYLEG